MSRRAGMPFQEDSQETGLVGDRNGLPVHVRVMRDVTQDRPEFAFRQEPDGPFPARNGVEAFHKLEPGPPIPRIAHQYPL